MMMHGIDEPRIEYKDTLSKSFNEPNQYNIIMAIHPLPVPLTRGISMKIWA
ncbi:MAG: hypothetical protein QM498_11450 [Desulfobacterium sp.]